MEYSKELTAIQMWLKSTAGLNSFKRGTSVNLSRPVVLFDVPGRGRARHLTRYSYVQTVTWPCTLYVDTLDEAVRYQEALVSDLEDRCNVLEHLKQLPGTLKQIASQKLTGLVESMKNGVTSAKDLATNLKTMAQQKVTSLVASFREFKSTIQEGRTGVVGFVNALKNIGKISVTGAVNGVKSLASNMKTFAAKSDLAYGVVPLAVAYCHGLSDKANLMEYLQDQYLCLTGVDVDENEVLKMRKARALALKDKDSKASFIAQSQDDNAVENGLTRTKNDIMDTTNTPRLAELNGATATEIKMKYAGLDIKAGKKEPLLIQAFRSFFAIITDLLNVQKLYAAGTVSGVYETITTPELIEARDDLYQSEWLEVTISRNLPQNNKEIADIVAELADIVPDSYLYELLWFIDDPQKALEEMRAQKEESQQTSLTNSLVAIGYGADNLGDTGGDPDNPDDQQNSATGSTITQPPE